MAFNRKSTGFLVGIDFGKLRDHTAFSVVELIEEYDLVDNGFSGGQRENEMLYQDVVFLRRMELGLSYPRIVDIACKVVRELPDRPRKPVILADATGVGAAPIDYLRKSGLRPIAITFTSGMEVREVSSTELHVPKKDLVGSTTLALQNGTLRISPEIEHGSLLAEELRNFTLKVRESGHESFESGRESVHDDLTFSVMMCSFYASRRRPKPMYQTSKFLGYMER